MIELLWNGNEWSAELLTWWLDELIVRINQEKQLNESHESLEG